VTLRHQPLKQLNNILRLKTTSATMKRAGVKENYKTIMTTSLANQESAAHFARDSARRASIKINKID
jgi:hypothetical protein